MGEPAKTALITGAARRVGQAIALHLAREGWDIALHYHHSKKEAEETAALITGMGRRCALLEADLADGEAVATLIPRAVKELGSLTLLVNNASVFAKDSLDDFTREGWAQHMEVNLYAPLVLSRAFAQAFKKSGAAEGNIIHLTDGCEAWSLSPHFLTYALSKAGLASLVPLLALDLAPAIRVNGIAPGFTLPSPYETQAEFERLAEKSPLKRLSSPEEVCRAVDFILAAPNFTGQIIGLGGGLHLQSR